MTRGLCRTTACRRRGTALYLYEEMRENPCYPDVIGRFSLGPRRPQRSVGRHVHSFESPNSCPEPCSPYLARPGQRGVMMSAPQCFVGIDVAKAQLDIALRPTGERWVVGNDDAGIAALVARLQALQ